MSTNLDLQTDTVASKIAEAVIAHLEKKYEIKERPKTLKLNEAGAKLGVTSDAVRKMIEAGKLERIPNTSPIRVRAEDVYRLMGERKVG